VAGGAAKLWTAVTGARKQRVLHPEASASDTAQGPSELAVLRTQVQDLEATVQQLQEQMQASSELIKALADQNTQLVQRAELQRVRLVRLALAAGASTVLMLSAIVYLGLGP
jgi:6-phosphogluconolactonase/glucosamine-6-phosphate isomerase/deaminase